MLNSLKQKDTIKDYKLLWDVGCYQKNIYKIKNLIIYSIKIKQLNKFYC